MCSQHVSVHKPYYEVNGSHQVRTGVYTPFIQCDMDHQIQYLDRSPTLIHPCHVYFCDHQTWKAWIRELIWFIRSVSSQEFYVNTTMLILAYMGREHIPVAGTDPLFAHGYAYKVELLRHD